MIPYIVALVFLIVIVLYQIYSTTESFSASRDASGNPIVTTRDASGNPIVTTRDASGNPIVATRDASGNEIRLSLSDLFGLLGPFKTTTQESKPAPILPEAARPPVTTSTSGSLKEIEDRIAKTVSKQIKDDLMAQRATDDLFDKYAPCELTDAEAQGQEYEKIHPRPSTQPDMSEYIRKDSIPCWNCSVP
jgi:YD repeat-containing protein